MDQKATDSINIGQYFHEIWDVLVATSMGWTPQEWAIAFIMIFVVLFIVKLVFNLLKTLIFVGLVGFVLMLSIYLYSMEPADRRAWIDTKVYSIKCFISSKACLESRKKAEANP